MSGQLLDRGGGMYCEKCGKFMPDNARFCGKCGNECESMDKRSQNMQKGIPVKKICMAILIFMVLICALIIFKAQKENPRIQNVDEGGNKTKIEKEHKILDKLSNFSISTVYLDMNDYIHKGDVFWIKGRDIVDDNWYLIGIDLDFNIHNKIKCTGSTSNIEQIIGEKFLLCYDAEGYYTLIDIEGNPVKIFTRNEKLYWASDDSMGGTVWTTESIDTYNSHDTILRAYDLNGNIRGEWSSVKLNEKYGMQWDGVLKEGKYKGLGNRQTVIEYVDEEIYYMNPGDHIIILNVATGADFGRKDNDEDIVVELVGESIYLCHSYGGVSSSISNKDAKVSIYDKQGNLNYYGNVGTPYSIYVDTLCYERYIGNGIFTSVDKSDTWSLPAIYLNYKSEVIYKAGDVKSRSDFCDGHAVISMCNDGNVYFTTMIDTNGNWLFEPIKGRYYDSYYYANSFNSFGAYHSGIEMYRISLDDKIYLLDKSGKTTLLTSDVNFYANINGTLNAVYLKDNWLYFNPLQ